MNKKSEIVSQLLHNKARTPQKESAKQFAPSNIAVIKYWGKRDQELMLPQTNSLSLSLADLGSTTTILHQDNKGFQVQLNKQSVPKHHPLSLGISHYLKLLPIDNQDLKINIEMNIPMSAGLASSACGYAALVKSLDQLYDWQLTRTEQSLLARLGSGSACRSMWHGFVEWEKGDNPMGWDSHGVALKKKWASLRIGIALISKKEKKTPSREAMQQCVARSKKYQEWPQLLSQHLHDIKQAINKKNFSDFGQIAEENAKAMHNTMLDIQPPICYSNPKTFQVINKIKELRQAGLECYYTQDAGPNIKIIHEQHNSEALLRHIPSLHIVEPFKKTLDDEIK
jgi:diphosphomevalonate decarboxylase